MQQQRVSDGKVVRTVDGDTVTVDVWGDGITTGQAIRNAGIQAMEVGQCHSAEAAKAMSGLVAGAHVRLTAQYAASSSLGRPVRFLDVVTPRGLVDPQLALLNAGHALPLVIPPETGRSKNYFSAAEKAAAAKRNIWSTSYCRSGPARPRRSASGSTGTAMGMRAVTSTANTCASSTRVPPHFTSADGGYVPPPKTPSRSRRRL